MPLIELKTNLKSLKFGIGTASDRPGGGYSNQPYIIKDIPSNESDPSNVFNTGGPDSLLRGGLMAPIKAIDDVSRLTQMFFDLKSPNGLLFSTKQNILSRTSVKTEASVGGGTGNGNVNQGIYLPTSTITQSGVGFLGTHGNLLGLNPLSPLLNNDSLSTQKSNFGLVKYEQISLFNNKSEGDWESSNRLLDVLYNKQNTRNPNPNIITYGGGPGSILGVGETNIKFAGTTSRDRTGINNPKTKPNPYSPSAGYTKPQTPSKSNAVPVGGVSRFWSNSTQNLTITEINNNFTDGDGFSVYSKGSWPKNTNLQKVNNSHTWTQSKIIQEPLNVGSKSGNPVLQDFRKKTTLGTLNPSYKPSDGRTLINRVNLGDPGRKNISNSYTVGNGVLDKITASSIYSDTTPDHGPDFNDLVKLSIGILRNDGTGTSDYFNFRSYIDSFSDAYTADWGTTQYIGRGDKFYNYKGFDRSINLSWTVYAASKPEILPMYRKLNFLASSLSPEYSNHGFMQGNLARLTVGGYLYNQLGIIRSITYDVPSESTWEIGIDTRGKFDDSVEELPHMIKVTGFTFTPIEHSVPKKGHHFIHLAHSGKSDHYGKGYPEPRTIKSSTITARPQKTPEKTPEEVNKEIASETTKQLAEDIRQQNTQNNPSGNTNVTQTGLDKQFGGQPQQGQSNKPLRNIEGVNPNSPLTF